MSVHEPRIFISYSHRGRGPEWKNRLVRALAVFEQQQLLDVWEDGQIRISAGWDDEIAEAIASASLAVVLLTPEALASQYIVQTEMPALRKRWQRERMPIFPVICESCRWKEQEESGWLHAIQSPAGAAPLADLPDAVANRHLRDLATAMAGELCRRAPQDYLIPGGESIRADDPRCYLEKFPIELAAGLREERLIGREQELALLDLAFTRPGTAIVSLVAGGGVGKTMLVRQWLRNLRGAGWAGARRVYAWTFYSQGASEDRQASEDGFLAHALGWFGVPHEPTLAPWDKGRLLADAVSRERTLLVLDGIEPLQYPPGPMGGQLRAPGVQSLLKRLARTAGAPSSGARQPGPDAPGGLCLVTTREPLADLAEFQRREGSRWGSVLRVDLGNLTREAGAALLHHAGAVRAGAAQIEPEDRELLAASREVGDHALTLNLLGRFLARAHGGDIRRRDLVKFEEADRCVQGGTTFRMLAAFETWFARSGEFGMRQLTVLRLLGLFNRPAEADCLGALRRSPAIGGLTDPLFHSKRGFLGWSRRSDPIEEEAWNMAVSFLADFGLVDIQGRSGHRDFALDCHPLIREYFDRQVSTERPRAWRAAHRRLFHELKDGTKDLPNPTLDELQPLCHAVAHGCQAGLHDDALRRIFWPRIQRNDEYYCVKKLGAFDVALSAAFWFFRPPWKTPAPELAKVDRSLLLGHVGLCLLATGRLAEAEEATRAGVGLALERRDWKNAAAGGGNLCEIELAMGEITPALRDAEQSVALAERSGDPFQRMSKRTHLADALHQAGRVAEALALFGEAETMHAKWQPHYPLLYSRMSFMYCDLLLTAPETIAWRHTMTRPDRIEREPSATPLDEAALRRCDEVTRRALQTLLWAKQNRVQQMDIPLDNLTLLRAALYRIAIGRLPCPHSDPALEARLAVASDGLRRAGQQQETPRSLLTRAWMRRMQGDSSAACSDLDEAWDIAARGPMRLHMADIRLYRARLFFRERQYPWKSPQDDLASAQAIIAECGYHRRDEELADAGRAILEK